MPNIKLTVKITKDRPIRGVHTNINKIEKKIKPPRVKYNLNFSIKKKLSIIQLSDY